MPGESPALFLSNLLVIWWSPTPIVEPPTPIVEPSQPLEAREWRNTNENSAKTVGSCLTGQQICLSWKKSTKKKTYPQEKSYKGLNKNPQKFKKKHISWKGSEKPPAMLHSQSIIPLFPASPNPERVGYQGWRCIWSPTTRTSSPPRRAVFFAWSRWMRMESTAHVKKCKWHVYIYIYDIYIIYNTL